MTPTLFADWLRETRQLQVDVYRADYSRFGHGAEATEAQKLALIAYIDVMFAATIHEMVELHDETRWKPWQHDEAYVNRDAAVGEVVDALHFLANVLCALDVSDEELTERYAAKMQVNRDRQLRASGYFVQAPGTKCRMCHRALDDVKPALTDPTICMNCLIQEALQNA